jgi:hypothetical protein
MYLCGLSSSVRMRSHRAQSLRVCGPAARWASVPAVARMFIGPAHVHGRRALMPAAQQRGAAWPCIGTIAYYRAGGLIGRGAFGPVALRRAGPLCLWSLSDANLSGLRTFTSSLSSRALLASPLCTPLSIRGLYPQLVYIKQQFCITRIPPYLDGRGEPVFMRLISSVHMRSYRPQSLRACGPAARWASVPVVARMFIGPAHVQGRRALMPAAQQRVPPGLVLAQAAYKARRRPHRARASSGAVPSGMWPCGAPGLCACGHFRMLIYWSCAR